jgi:ketosteroid isomerase-like protein
MKFALIALLILSTWVVSSGQNYPQQIYDTERAFEKMVAEKGINAGFIEYLSPTGVMFFPAPANARETWRARPLTSAALTWNPIKIEVSSNGALGYSIGNSIFRPKGKNDPNEFHGHYLSIWTRQPNGEYRAALDTGVDHAKPKTIAPTWSATATSRPPVDANPKKTFAGDSTIGFYQLAESRGLAKAYKEYAAEDLYLFRQEMEPFVGRKAAISYLEGIKLRIKFVKRRSFIEAGDLAYVYSSYSLHDENGVEKETGSFVQVWKLRGGRWQIAADVFIPIPRARS